MIKRSLLAGVLALGCVATSFATKLGTVNMPLVFKSAPQIQAIDAKLKTQFHARQAKLMSMQASLEKQQKDIKKNESVMKQSRLKTLQDKFAADMQAFQTERSSYKKAVYEAQTAAMNTFTTDLKGVIAKVAAKKGVDFVFAEREALYSAPGTDLTQPVLAALKKKAK